MEFLCHMCDRPLVIFLVNDNEGNILVRRYDNMNDCQCPHTADDLMDIMDDGYTFEA